MKVSVRQPEKTSGLSRSAAKESVAPVAEEKKTPDTAFTRPAQHASVHRPDGPAPGSRVKFSAHVDRTVFDGWLKVHEVTVKITRGGVEQTVHLKLLQRPGHDSTHVATLRLNGDGPPTLVYKDGDTRPAAAMRGTPYVATGIIAGSLDHEGVDAELTALMEIAEEVGGQPLGKLLRLGDALPTMPVTDGDGDVASSESDNYWLGVLSSQQGEIKGDGGGLEIVGLMKPVDLSVGDALKKIDSGGIRENARARVALERGLDKMGFVPSLNKWVRDLPPGLQQKFDTLGLGETYDPRTATTPVELPAHEAESPKKPGPPPQNMHLAAKVNDVDLGAPKLLELGNGTAMIDSRVNHLAPDGAGNVVRVGNPTPVQTLHTNYDRLKLAQYYVDPKLGPMVKLELAERPILAAKMKLLGSKESVVRQDVIDLRVQLPEVKIENGKVVGAEELDQRSRSEALKVAQAAVPGAKIEALSAPSYASPGQADLRYHFLSAEVDPGQAGGGFVPIAEALRKLRSGGAGDANTEALLTRLADRLEWVPQLGMSVEQARAELA